MPTSAQRKPEPGTAAADTFPSACADLSNDFLNHYSEVLMLIEMAGYDPAIAAEIQEWRPIGYRAYFAASQLRRASAALTAYEALPDARREAFEKLVAAMDALATMAIFALQPPSEPESAPVVIAATAPALRGLIAKAAAFFNSGGQDLAPESNGDETQAVIDRIIRQGSG
jgi:hypothetical protein